MSNTYAKVRHHPWRFMATLAGFAVVLGFTFMIVGPRASADAGSTIPGSPFNGHDGVQDTTVFGGAQAGESIPCKNDQPSGSGDNSFTQGAKEDTINPAVGSGAIPPNKSDLNYMCVKFATGNTTLTADHLFAYVFVNRLPTTGGTAFFDVEFNQGSAVASDGLPIRTAGDLLLSYSFPGGNKTPTLTAYTWVTSGVPRQVCESSTTVPCWGKSSGNLLTGGCAEASVSTNLLNWEVAIDLTCAGLVPTGTSCAVFNSAYVKGTSSGFGSEMKDFILPETITQNKCGDISVSKVDDATPAAVLPGAVFTLYNDVGVIGTYQPGIDTTTGITCTTNALGTCNLGSTSIFFGNYCVVETTGVLNHDLAAPQCITLDATHVHVTLTFIDPRQFGHIIVDKVTDPSLDPQSFTFTTTGSGYAGFSLTDAATPNDSGALLPGSYSVAETAVAGWDLTSATCDGGNTPGAITLGANQTVHCTFTNVKRSRIIVDKVTDPSGDPQSFTFTTTGSGYSGFSLTDAAAPNDSGLLVPGSYSVAETAVAGWDLTSATCDGGNTPGAITLGAGQTVHCTFTNVKRGHIIVDKVTVPAGATDSFTFTTTGSGYSGFSLTDAAPPNDSGALVPGSYSVAETLVAGWSLTSATCDGGNTPAAITLGAGQTVHCVFTNTSLFKLIVLTCNTTTERLVVSRVNPTDPLNFAALGAKDTLGTATVPSIFASGTTVADVEHYLCSLGGANFDNLPAGTYGADTTIPKP